MKDGKWWDYSWNIAPGCTKVGPECQNCWALAMAKRLQGMGKRGYEGLVAPPYPMGTMSPTLPPTPPHLHPRSTGAGERQMGRGVVKWTGKVNLLDWRLKEVMRLKRPRVIAVNLMGDLFHPNVPDAFIERVFLMMTAAWWHKFMVLTKRPERAVDFFKAAKRIPLSNIWMGTTAGTQRSANERWGAMAWLEQAGWRTWVSSEPRLEAIDWHGWAFLRWMVTGGESGPYARPMSPAWARADRDWCQEHGVAFWFKQWGEWGSTPTLPPAPPHFGVHEMGRERRAKNEIDESEYPMTTMGREMVFRFGRKLAGRMLDGRTWEDTPLDFPFGGEEALR